MPTRFEQSRTAYQTMFSVTPWPQILPCLLTARKTFPSVSLAAAIHLSTVSLTHIGMGTVRTRPPLPTRSTTAQCLTALDIRNVQRNELRATQSTSKENGNHGAVSLAMKRLALCALQQALRLFEIQPVAQSLSQLLYSLDPPDPSR